MRQTDIDQLGKAAYSTPLRPGKVRELGEHAQTWGVCVYGTLSRKNDRFLTLTGVALDNGVFQAYLTPDQFPKPGKRGLSLKDFAETILRHLPNVTQKTRVLLLAYGTAQNYGPLDVYDLDARVSFTPAGGDAYSLKYRDGDSGPNIEFLDAAAFFPDQELSDVARTLGVNMPLPAPRHPDPADLATRAYITAQARTSWQVWASLRDTFGREYEIDPVVYRTPASCAARVYVSRYLEQAAGGDIGVRKYIRLQAMRSYWGARAEAFARGPFTGDLNLYDAVSLYPSAAIALGEMPTGNSWFRLTHTELTRCKGGICTVDFEFPADELHPCLPVNATGTLLYPLAGRSHCTVHEVRYALQCGAKITLISGYGYNRGDSSLAQYSRDMLAQKNAAEQRGDAQARTMYKLLLNSLYGKFGQHRVGHSLDTLRAVCRALKLPGLDVLENIPNWEQMAGDILGGGEGKPIEPEVVMGGQWCVEWAALIQGYARYIESRAMREYVALLGTTDSVLINGDAGDEFYIDDVKFKREARGDRAVIVRARLYALAQGDTITHAALHGAPKTENAPAALLAWAGGDTLTVKADRVRKLRAGLMDGGKVGTVQAQVTHLVSMAWDSKRSLVGDYSTPYDFIACPDAD